ncbi:7553_t:CDS:2, partial [Cetraspora pellucida]
KLQNMPMGVTKKISNQVLDAFQYVEQITSIKPLMFEGTTVCSDQWLLKEAKEFRERNKTQSPLALETNFSQNNSYVKVLQEKEQTDETTDTKDTTLQCILENKKMIATDAALKITNNDKATTTNSATKAEEVDAEMLLASNKTENNQEEALFTT